MAALFYMRITACLYASSYHVEFSEIGCLQLMDKVDGMMDVLDPESKDLNKQRPSTRVTPGNEGKQKPDEAADIDDKHATLDLGSLAASNA